MRILELNFEKTWRGGERQTLYCLRGFKAKGIDVAVLCRTGYPMQKKAEAEGLKTYNYKTIWGAIWFLLTHGKHFDIFHVETAGVLTYAVLTKPFHRTKVIYTRRVDFVPDGFFTWLKYRWTDKLVAISTAIRRILSDFSRRNIELISEIFEIKELDTQRAVDELKNAGIDSNKKIVANVAAMEQHKDPLTMVETIKILKEQRTDFIFLHFGNGRLEEDVKAKVDEYGLGDVYKVMGFKNNVEDFFSVFDVFVMSSEQEGLGSSVLDAFIYKVPVVSTKAGGLKDLVGEGRGVLCNIKAPREMATGISEMIDNTELKEEVTQKAYDYVQEQHNIKYITDKYVDLFERLLNK